MRIGRIAFWYYLLLLVIIIGALVLGDFGSTNFSERLVITVFLTILLLAPLIFLARGGLVVKTISQELRQLRELRETRDKLEARARELEIKDRELILANERLVELNRAKSEFISFTVHQLRSPLATLRWSAELLLRGDFGPVGAEQRKAISQGYETVGRLIVIINNLLNLDRLEKRNIEYEFAPLELGSFFDSLVYQFAGRAKEKGITFEVERPADPLPTIEGDPIKLAMVFENLLDNAIKYTPTNGRVTLAVRRVAADVLEATIADTGIGIPKRDWERVFLRFGRGSNVRGRDRQGFGLGLFIAKQIIERHGGRLWFESEEGRGSVFHLTLPLRPPKL